MEEFLDLTKRPGFAAECDIEAIWAKLPAVSEPSFMIGEWTGSDFENDHPDHTQLKAMKWADKTFESVDDVDPIMVYDEEGKRVFSEPWGHARWREVKLWGLLSTCMVYDKHPIIDQFRYVHDDLVAGAMDIKPFSGRVYYFYLHRNEKKL
ncbi:hypothetical protein AOQ84DRAFT_374735 [Glonium stellatum]|uniref:DUF4334 domain-containing protein n=1 Tax=Glonium stellatum TaxID=574774 RepID=A0A8E2F4Y0_9PEZI|nr:hypothetical protein AOQ84DRAFT_374735 [Glonium stellatum]